MIIVKPDTDVYVRLDAAQNLWLVANELLTCQVRLEVTVLDLGWAVQIGEWRADPLKFPRGLAPIADRAHELGLKFGLHIPLGQAHTSSPVARQNPDWLITCNWCNPS